MLPTLIGKTDPENYQRYLDQKIEKVLQLFSSAGLEIPAPEIFPSPPEFYRMRCEFALYKDEDEIRFAMYVPSSKPKERILLNEFRGAHQAINAGMAALQQALSGKHPLKPGLFETDFLCTQDGQLIISLDYHRKFDEAFVQELRKLRDTLRTGGLKVDLIARARRQKILCDKEEVLETYHLKDKDCRLYQVEGTFSQPNAACCTHMLNFARECAEGCKERDLLELYCGSGTFTTALADCFRQVLATEVARVPTRTALKNLALNGITNVKLCRLDAVETAQALSGVREFNRLTLNDINIRDYNFSTLLVDPPRCGIGDPDALSFDARFERIIYISCGPQSLCEDLKVLTKTHRIERLAFFDQFPYTDHIESGVLLSRR